MAKKKTKTNSGFDRTIAISSAITVFLAEVVPFAFFNFTFWWQERSLVSFSEVQNFMAKGAYSFNDVSKFGIFSFGMGVLFTLGMLVFLSVLLVDEWIYSHKLESLKRVFTLALAWSASYYIVDSLIAGNVSFPTLEAISAGVSPRILVSLYLFVVPFIIFYVRKYVKNRKK